MSFIGDRNNYDCKNPKSIGQNNIVTSVFWVILNWMPVVIVQIFELRVTFTGIFDYCVLYLPFSCIIGVRIVLPSGTGRQVTTFHFSKISIFFCEKFKNLFYDFRVICGIPMIFTKYRSIGIGNKVWNKLPFI